jgi:hypothetical protein
MSLKEQAGRIWLSLLGKEEPLVKSQQSPSPIFACSLIFGPQAGAQWLSMRYFESRCVIICLR